MPFIFVDAPRVGCIDKGERPFRQWDKGELALNVNRGTPDFSSSLVISHIVFIPKSVFVIRVLILTSHSVRPCVLDCDLWCSIGALLCSIATLRPCDLYFELLGFHCDLWGSLAEWCILTRTHLTQNEGCISPAF